MPETDQPRALTLFLTTAPFASESPSTTLNLAEAALEKGYQVNLFLSADGVYCAVAGQKAIGLPPVADRILALTAKGLRGDLCGSCLQLRGLKREVRIEGPQPSSLKNLFTMVAQSKAFIALGR